jgi:two-component system OmpR family response regulator
MAKVLVVEDDELLRQLLSQFLTKEGYQVETANNGSTGMEMLQAHEYAVVVLDWDLPGMLGIDILRTFRALGKQTPVLMLTHKSTIADKEAGFTSGTDDYLPKPFEMRELALRISALLRRPAQFTGQWLTAGDLKLDPASRVVRRGDEEINLLPKEFALLEFFMRRPREVFTSDALLSHVWSSDSEASEEAVSICIRRLRKKIDRQGQNSIIKTLHGQGYKLDC